MDELQLRLALGRAQSLQAGHVSAALQRLGSLEGLFGARTALLESCGVPPAAAAWLHAPDEAQIEADRRLVERESWHLIGCVDPAYPALLARIAHAPALLYVKGNPAVLAVPQLAMVGTRNPTPAARRTATEFAAALVHAGLAITSGLALGIDAAGHEGALAAAGRSIAVLGSALDRLYPPEHHGLAQRIAERGALVCKYPPGTPPRRGHFPQRNRIISGLSLGALIVEAGRYSGSLGTAALAAEQGREVFAIPGSIHNPLTRGCRALIRSGATLVETVDDVLRKLQISLPEQRIMQFQASGSRGHSDWGPLDKDSKILLDALGCEPAGIDALAERTGLPSQSIASMLLILELQGIVGLHVGGQYVRTGRPQVHA